VAEPEKFAPIFRRHFDVIFRYLAKRVDPTTAEDLAAETFVQAFAHRSRFDPSRESALPWLYGIATNLLRHHRRRERVRLTALTRTGIRLREPTIDSERAEELTAVIVSVLNAMETLEPSDRDVLVLHAWEDLSYSQVAEALEIPIGTVRSRLHRARALIRERIDPPEAMTNRASR